MVKIVKSICVEPDGELILREIELVQDHYNLGPSCKLFDCCYCKKIAPGMCSQGPEFVRSKYTFVLYNYDVHSEKNFCKAPKNIHSNSLLDVNCSCGYSCENHNYRGSMYLLKHDPKSKKNQNMISPNQPITH